MTVTEYLAQKLDTKTATQIADYLNKHQCAFIVTGKRKSKLGDFRVRGKALSISLNEEPNLYRYTITLVHEIAHLKTFIEYKNRVKPHGEHWKQNFRILLHDFGIRKFFKDESSQRIFDMVYENPSATAGIDLELESLLHQFDPKTEGDSHCFLADLPMDTYFEFNQKVFQKKKTLRSRVLCQNVQNSRMYAISLSGKVKPVKKEDLILPETKTKASDVLTLYQIPMGQKFELQNTIYLLKSHRKTRALCQCVKSRKLFTIPMHLEVRMV